MAAAMRMIKDVIKRKSEPRNDWNVVEPVRAVGVINSLSELHPKLLAILVSAVVPTVGLKHYSNRIRLVIPTVQWIPGNVIGLYTEPC